jgi:hypothetical protein
MRYTKGAIAIAAAMSLLLAACGEDADDASGDTTAPTDVAVEDTATSPDDAASEVDEPSPTVSAPVSGTRAEVGPIAVGGPAVVLDEESDQHWLLPWRDGFLSFRVEFGPQASPELPEELAALLPQEVWDLFPDGLPPTLEEAQQIVSDAGLLDVVLDAMNESEELSAAIRSGETPVEVAADFTTDGVIWESLPIELSVDPAAIQQVVSTGDEIALYGGGGPLYDISPEHEYYVAISNGSLVDWSVETLAAPPVEELGDIFHVEGYVTFDANDDRWIVRLATGVGSDPYMEYEMVAGSWSAEWGEEPTYTAADEDEPWTDIHAIEAGFGHVLYTPEALIATESGFLKLAEPLEFSTDGVHWTPVEGAPADLKVIGTMPIGDGTIVLMNGRAGTRPFLVSPDMQQWQEVLVDGLPRDFGSNDWYFDSLDSVAEVIIAPSGVWLLATTDGETWIVDPLGADDGSHEVRGFRAARNGSTVLLFGPEGWARYELGG